MGGGLPQRLEDRSHAEARASATFGMPDVSGTGVETDEQQAERRNEQRRALAHANRFVTRQRKGHKANILPRDWGWIAALLFASPIVGGLASMSWPPLPVLAAALVGSAFAFLGAHVARREREIEAPEPWMVVLAWITLIVPIVAVGSLTGYWTVHGDLDWRWACAGLVTANALSASLLSGRIPQQLTLQIACWVPVVAFDANPASLAAMIVATVGVFFVGRHQARLNRRRSERDQERERIRNRAEEILRDYEETGQGWFWETDRRGLLTYVSASVAETLRRQPDDLLHRPFSDLFDPAGNSADSERTLTFHLSSRSSFQELGVRAHIEGEDRWWSVSGRPAYDTFGNFLGFRGSGTDLTEKKRSQESVQRLAQYDSLTGLANRFQMHQTLERMLSAPIGTQCECSVFLLDLDRFKQVNDTLGHPAGDALLQQVAQRLERAIGGEGRVGRLGGDEFKVVLPGHVARERLSQLAQGVIESLSQPYSIGGQRVVIGASIGIAVSPEHGETVESLVRNADLALYAAKDAGRGRLHFYSEHLHSAAEERARLEEELRDAIAHGGLELHYQPVVRARDCTIAGFEALLRWNHPRHGWLSPHKFIPVAEDTGLINAIGEWAIRTACDDLSRWPREIRCAVNVSSLQFANPQLPSIVTHAIAAAQIDPARLELEITESVFLNDDAGTEGMFAALKRVGVRLAMDDFGTGYSSLGYLKRAPFDKIKIDQSFVRGATQPGSRNSAILASITGLAKSLGMDTTAEGVETLDELELVRGLGCSQVQGYIFSKAVPFDVATELIANGPKMRPSGYRSARAPRQAMLRKVVLEHAGEYYDAKIRNLSEGGAMIEGLWHVPPGTGFNIAVSPEVIVAGSVIWANEYKMGVEFERVLDSDSSGRVILAGLSENHGKSDSEERAG